MTALLTGLAVAAPLVPADFASLGTLAPVGPILVDTDVPEIRGAVAVTGVYSGGVAVFAFDDVTIDADVLVVGRHPAALLSRGDLVVGPGGAIVASAQGPAGGPGGFGGGFRPSTGPCRATSPCPEAFGKGPGGGLSNEDGAGGGGYGGRGGKSASAWNCEFIPGMVCADPSGDTYGDLVVGLIGGSGGAGLGDWFPLYYFSDGHRTCAGGGGGGAVELGATGNVRVDGTIDVRGSAGVDHRSPPNLVAWAFTGGGAGGGVLVHGSGGSLDGVVLASGGAGQSDYDGAVPGAGGGGGRITVMGLDSVLGVLDVTGGYSGADSGDPGVIVIDADSDWLDDLEEVAVHGTDPMNADTDGGGVIDGRETRLGLDPTWMGDDPPVPVLTIVSGGGLGGTTFEATGMHAGSPVQLVSSVSTVSRDVPGCAQATPLGIGPTLTVRDAAAPSGGVATLEAWIPLGTVGTRWFVAVQPDTCRVTNVVSVTVP